ncbi:hypothetical protein TNCV_3938421 [Trichonephila clavipes]|nr:hypothetical protein TNCV_3938421 [Trichonephila clavipes]
MVRFPQFGVEVCRVGCWLRNRARPLTARFKITRTESIYQGWRTSGTRAILGKRRNILDTPAIKMTTQTPVATPTMCLNEEIIQPVSHTQIGFERCCLEESCCDASYDPKFCLQHQDGRIRVCGILVNAHWQSAFVIVILAHHLASCVLRTMAPPFIQALRKPTFQQDNRRTHVACIVRNFLDKQKGSAVSLTSTFIGSLSNEKRLVYGCRATDSSPYPSHCD